ncbi:MAG: amidohydrolase family protein [Phycisphaeraceae bacterium]
MPSIIDTHLHLWDPGRFAYPWLEGVPALNKPYLIDDYDRDCGDHVVEQMVFIQCECTDPFEELAWVSSIAERDRRITGIVPWAPLERGEAARGHIEQMAAHPLVKGVRRIIENEVDPEFCVQPAFVRGVQLLAEFNLSFDLCISHTQLPATISLVQQCPNVRFILDHIAKPVIRKQIFEPWRTYLSELAKLPNVACKISGMVVEADHQNWAAADLKPYVEHVMACFGSDRVMFGSDWPVVRLASETTRWIETLEKLTQNYSELERTKLFHDNAQSFYRLPSEPRL